MSDQPAEDAAVETAGTASRSLTPKLAVALVVLALFGGLLAAKSLRAPLTASSEQASPSLTSTHNDAVADFDRASATGRPIYLLFHSLS